LTLNAWNHSSPNLRHCGRNTGIGEISNCCSLPVGYHPGMHWWQFPLIILVAAWAIYLYATPSAKVTEHLAKLRDWWKSRAG
jgi:hypothetical protein